jgi:hypothetical protein
MRTSVPLTEKQRKAMLPYEANVGEIYRTLDWPPIQASRAPIDPQTAVSR